MTAAIIEARDLVKRFDSFTAVDHISFAVPKGVIFGFLGPNGAGKTTTIRMLTTGLMPSAGRLVIAGHDPELPLAWVERRRQHLDRRRLAGAVGAEKAEDDAFRHLKRDMVDRGEIVEALDKIAGLDDCGHHILPNNSPQPGLSL